MTILIDEYGHMVATESEEELHAFARKIGLKREWYQDHNKYHCHYDITTQRKRKTAIAAGAVATTSIDLLRRRWQYEDYQKHKERLFGRKKA